MNIMSKFCHFHTAEFENIVTITEQPMPVMAGDPVVLTCNVRADDPSVVEWLGPNGVPVRNSDFIYANEPSVHGNKTTLDLYFVPVHTSHAGVYVCCSNVTRSDSVETASHNVTVQSKFTVAIWLVVNCSILPIKS